MKMRPERQPGETYEEYKLRRKVWNEEIRKHLKGRVVYQPHRFIEGPDGKQIKLKGKPYAKEN